jgi:hypothetical protein
MSTSASDLPSRNFWEWLTPDPSSFCAAVGFHGAAVCGTAIADCVRHADQASAMRGCIQPPEARVYVLSDDQDALVCCLCDMYDLVVASVDISGLYRSVSLRRPGYAPSDLAMPVIGVDTLFESSGCERVSPYALEPREAFIDAVLLSERTLWFQPVVHLMTNAGAVCCPPDVRPGAASEVVCCQPTGLVVFSSATMSRFSDWNALLESGAFVTDMSCGNSILAFMATLFPISRMESSHECSLSTPIRPLY